MILRITSSVVPQSKSQDYLDYLETEEIPKYERAPGLVAVILSSRQFVAYLEVMMLSLWSDQQFMAKFIEHQPPAQNTSGTVNLEPRVYNVVQSGGRFVDH